MISLRKLMPRRRNSKDIVNTPIERLQVTNFVDRVLVHLHSEMMNEPHTYYMAMTTADAEELINKLRAAINGENT